jgi:hypothetical protein
MQVNNAKQRFLQMKREASQNKRQELLQTILKVIRNTTQLQNDNYNNYNDSKPFLVVSQVCSHPKLYLEYLLVKMKEENNDINIHYKTLYKLLRDPIIENETNIIIRNKNNISLINVTTNLPEVI